MYIPEAPMLILQISETTFYTGKTLPMHAYGACMNHYTQLETASIVPACL